jgi:isopentenyl-diphosphate delta-isomerase type 1
MTELFDVLDKNGNKTGIQKTKEELHEQGLWHQAVHIWIFNSKGEILFQKRAKEKDNWPGLWDISAAGHVSAGETPEKAVVREMEEEIGIKVRISQLKKIEIRKHVKYVNKLNFHNREFDHVFLFRYDGDISKLKFKDKEVESVKFIPFKQLEKELKNRKLSKTYVPAKKYYFDIINIVKKEMIK